MRGVSVVQPGRLAEDVCERALAAPRVSTSVSGQTPHRAGAGPGGGRGNDVVILPRPRTNSPPRIHERGSGRWTLRIVTRADRHDGALDHGADRREGSRNSLRSTASPSQTGKR